MDLVLFATSEERDAALILALRTLPRTATLRYRFRIAPDPRDILAEVAADGVAHSSSQPARAGRSASTMGRPHGNAVLQHRRAARHPLSGAALRRAGVDLMPVKWDPATGGLAMLEAAEAEAFAA